MSPNEKPSMLDVDIIIPCYGASEKINRGVAMLATQWKRDNIHVTLVDDQSPNTDCHYQDLVDKYKDLIDIQVLVKEKNEGQGLTRQYGIDHTSHKWFMFMDEDDMFATPIAVSQFVGVAETYGMVINPDGTIKMKDGKPEMKDDIPELALVSGPLFEFDDHHTHVIPAHNQVWLNSKLYNRDFLEAHNIRFNEAQSRHAEDYFFMSCFFYALNHDPDWSAVLLNDKDMFYIWYPNEESQSRVDPHYGYMLSGYTMNGSVNILKWMKDSRNNKITKSKETQEDYDNRVLNMTIYSYFTFLAFIDHVKNTDYVPKLELDWTLLRDSCKELRDICLSNWGKYPYIRKLEEIFRVKNQSDVRYVEPWIEFDTYIKEGMDEFSWSFEQLMRLKK